jgi:FkbM family methyltransferase
MMRDGFVPVGRRKHWVANYRQLGIMLTLCFVAVALTRTFYVQPNTSQPKQNPAIHLSNMIKNLTDPVSYYASHVTEFCNKCDLDLYRVLLPRLHCCKNGGIFLIGGLNNGVLADVVVQNCPTATIHGFEIQANLYQILRAKYANNPNVKLVPKGWSDVSGSSPVTGEGEGAGLYVNFRNESRWDGTRKIVTTSIREYLAENHIPRVCMAIIDVEGFEPKVLQGIPFGSTSPSVPLIAFELGGTWADSRNPTNWTQATAAAYMASKGYNIYLMGQNELMPVDDNFFSNSRSLNEGYGYFVQGNALAVHSSLLIT